MSLSVRSGMLLAAFAAVGQPVPLSASLVAARDVACNHDEFAVGLTGRRGSWLDAVGPICERWDSRAGRTTMIRRYRPIGGDGGGPLDQRCPAGAAITGWRVSSIIDGDAAYAAAIDVECSMLAAPHAPAGGFRFAGDGGGRPPGRNRPNWERCPKDKLVNQVDVWTAIAAPYVTHVSMRCAYAP